MQKIFDAHSDLLYDLWINKINGVANSFDKHATILGQSNITAAIWTLFSPNDFDLIDALKISLKEIDLNRLKPFKVILGLEGLRNLKSIDDLDIIYNMGFRHAMLTWNEKNRWAAGAKITNDCGLTDDGALLIDKMKSLSMIIDLAHLNEKSFFDVLNHLNYDYPYLIYSHGNIFALHQHRRNVNDRQLQALKKANALLGLTLASDFISNDNPSLDEFMEHVRYAIDKLGIDNVCFGFDFMDYFSNENSNLREVNDASKTNLIVEKLYEIGLDKEAVNKICYLNLLKRFQKHILFDTESENNNV